MTQPFHEIELAKQQGKIINPASNHFSLVECLIVLRPQCCSLNRSW